MKGQVILAKDVVAGDRVILPMIGPRVVLEANESTFGINETPCIRIIYALGAAKAWESRNNAPTGASSTNQPEAGLRPYLPDERVAVERREQ